MTPDGRARWTVYILRCRDDSLYIGITTRLAARVAQHNAGRGAKYTRGRGPVVLAWSRAMPDGTRARRVEHALKQLTRASKQRLLAGDRALWRRVCSAVAKR